MSSKKKTNTLAKTDDHDSIEQPTNVTSNDSINDLTEPTSIHKKDIKIVFIPKSLHEHFECVVGKHVFVDKPWTKIVHAKIIDNLQSDRENSCFWKFRRKLEGIQNKYVLVGYKPFSNTDEEFIICTTDKAKQYIEDTQIEIDRELRQKVDRSMHRVSGPWESKNSEKDIEEIKPVKTREKITYKWKLPADRLQAKANFEDSTSRSMKSDYVKLEPRSKEIFETSDVFTKDSSVQAVRKMVNREMQTIPRIKDNKCIQSVAVEEEMFQLQPLTKSDKALNDFLEKHVPNLVNQLHYNELYDLYRDDYKLLKNEDVKHINQNSKVIKLLPCYQNMVSQKKYVSYHAWHPTIPGIFAVSYTSNSNALYKSVNLEKRAEEVTKSTAKDEKYGISYADDENNQECWNNQAECKLADENYREKLMSLLNKEFVQRMRIIQINEDEKSNEKFSQDIMKQLRSSTIYVSQEQLTNSQSNLEISGTNRQINRNDDPIYNTTCYEEFYETLTDENITFNEEQNDLVDVDVFKNIDEWKALNSNKDYSTEEYEYEIQCKEIKKDTVSTITVKTNEDEDKDAVDHHDSDTDSFYNIWGDDEEWLYGNKLRNVVRNIHRKFNQKYDREAREEKLFRLLSSEAKYTEKKDKFNDNMEKERIKLTKDMFEAGDIHKRLKIQEDLKSKKRRKSSMKYKILHNEEESIIKRENTSLINEQNNSVIIWSINDNILPKLRLESPEEVCCVEFNPRNGNTVVGGLTNGQICIWDISGKLETIDSNDLNMSEKEKKHHKHLWMHMKWSLDVQFKTRIRPAALSAILESHESMVTAIQWIHPMNEITPLGKLVTTPDGQFSDQFFSSSMDGTIKLWDLHSTPLPKSDQKRVTNSRFGRPENLNSYESPLSIYNNRLKPSYTITITEPENTKYSPITAMSFEIPLMQYHCTSDQPLVIGKRQFEYIPTTPNDPNRMLVVGSIMGQVGVVTWNGFDTRQSGQNTEECKHIWWGQVHDGPINCIKRNAFYPDIHLVCGGNVVSIWSLNYQGGPVWWKRFDDFTNSVLWSTVHPAEFFVSFNVGGVLQFWNLMKYTHQPYFTSDIFLSDGLIATLSAPHPSIHYVGAAEPLAFAGGMNEVLDHGKNELICFSDSAGTIVAIAVDAAVPGPGEVQEVGRVFQKEVDWRTELDEWNDKYRAQFGSIGENNVDDYSPAAVPVSAADADKAAALQQPRPTLTQEQIKRRICDETFKWYFNRSGPQTRLGKMREKYLEREKRHMIEAMMKKKNVDEKQLEEYFKGIETKKYDEDDMAKIRLEADETYKDIVNKLMAAGHTEEYVFDIDSKRSTESDDIKNTFEKIHRLLVTDITTEKEKLRNYIKNNPYKAEQEDWNQVIELAEREVRDRFNDPTLLKSPALRLMRRKLAKKYINKGYKIKESRNRKDEHACDRYKIREKRINKLRAMYGKNYDPYWDKDQQPQKMKDAMRMRVKGEEVDNEDNEQSYDSYIEGESGEDDSCYADYLSLMETNSVSSNPDQCREISVYDRGIRETSITESENLNINRRNTEYDKYHELEGVDEQNQAEENTFSIISNESNEHDY